MIPPAITKENTEFVLLSFEGPDPYSTAGGLGVRVSSLASALADIGHITHLIFLGDPYQPGSEDRNRDRLALHRWCQWISQYYPDGVYQGEHEKLNDFNNSVPPFVVDHIVRPALEQKRMVAILGEEWHTAEAMCRISAQLESRGLRDRVLMFWNANNALADHLKATREGSGADTINLTFHCPQEFLRIVYNASNAVLANSGHEPFGLVGLETMAAGAIAFTGSTGEDYAIPFQNAIVLETSDPEEIEAYLMYLEMAPKEKQRIRVAARQTAKRYVCKLCTSHRPLLASEYLDSLSVDAPVSVYKTIWRVRNSSMGGQLYEGGSPG